MARAAFDRAGSGLGRGRAAALDLAPEPALRLAGGRDRESGATVAAGGVAPGPSLRAAVAPRLDRGGQGGRTLDPPADANRSGAIFGPAGDRRASLTPALSHPSDGRGGERHGPRLLPPLPRAGRERVEVEADQTSGRPGTGSVRCLLGDAAGAGEQRSSPNGRGAASTTKPRPNGRAAAPTAERRPNRSAARG
jgi:hypothetical protein